MSLQAFSRNTTTTTPPPVSSFNSPRKSSPIMLLFSSRKGRYSPGNDCLALMWPSADDVSSGHSLSPVSPSIKTHLGGTIMDSTHEHIDIKINSPHGEGSVALDKTTEVLMCPSGKTVVRCKSSMEAFIPSPNRKASPSRIKQLSLPYSPSSKPSPHSFLSSDSSPFPHSRGIGNSSLNFPGRSLLFDSSDKPPGDRLPSSARSSSPSSPTMDISSGGESPFSSIKKKGPRRRKISGKDKGGKVRFAGATEILEQDHPEDDLMMNHSRCPCFKFFLVVCLVVLFLSLLFYLSLWLVAQHRGSPVIIAGGESLQTILQMHVFGQPIVLSLLPQLLSGILAKDARDRTMVLMFHGQSGVGKTFVAELIGKKMFPEQAQNQCVHKFHPSFLEVREHLVTAYDYSIALEDFIDKGKSHYRTCPVGLYIIEDIDYDSSPNLLEAISFTLPSIRKRQSAQEQKMIFLLMTNLQGDALGHYLLSQLKEGKRREDVTLKELEPIMKEAPKALENTEDSHYVEQESEVQHLQVHTKIMALVDDHIPFLPLEREHVIWCIQQTLGWKNVTLNENDIEWIADQLAFYPESNPVFSLSGCKKVEEKANLISKYSQT